MFFVAPSWWVHYGLPPDRAALKTRSRTTQPLRRSRLDGPNFAAIVYLYPRYSIVEVGCKIGRDEEVLFLGPR
jgi:hypothetical protein